MALLRTIPAGDLALSAASDAVWIDGLAHRRQQISTRFRFFRGEWFRDLRLGIPYFEEIFVRDPNLDVARSIFRRALQRSPGVLSVPLFRLVPDYEARVLGFQFQAICDAGPLNVTERDKDFLIELASAA